MELRYVLITLLKILISTPNVLLLYNINEVYSAALMGGHLDNRSNASMNTTDTYYEYDFTDSQELQDKNEEVISRDKTVSEEIPDPSALVLPGYNLPENLFNHGKPFYVEKDPLTGQIDFANKSPTLKLESDFYDYTNEEPSDNIFDKSNIDRKDGNINSHKPSDVNQLTPNFHDFLNLPVKYNPDKYVYPLISSSYTSTKVQGSVNKYHNHKDYKIKTTTKKPTGSPTYYSTNKYFNPSKIISTPITTTTMATTETVTKRYPSTYLTPKPINLMNSEMSHPSFNEEFDYYDEISSTVKPKEPTNIYITTESNNNIYLTSKSPLMTTKRPLSLFEQLFGDYDETVPTTSKTVTSKIDYTTDKDSVSHNYNVKNDMPSTTPSVGIYNNYENSHAGPNILTGSSMGLDNNYDYEDYENGKYEDNVAVESRPVKNIEDDLKIEPLNVIKNEKKDYEKIKKPDINTDKLETKESTTMKEIVNEYNEYDYQEKEETVASTTAASTTNIKPTVMSVIKFSTSIPEIPIKVTSLPLGEHHVTNINRESINHDPIIVATQNLREKLNSEKVLPKPFEAPMIDSMMSGTQHTQPPSTSNIHIAPDQDTVSFVVGHHQNVGNDQYIETTIKDSPYDSNPFRPLYGQQATYSNNKHNIENEQVAQAPISLGQTYPEVVGSSVTIQPLKNSEASLAIGVPLTGMKQVPGQVVDEKLEINNNPDDFPKGSSKIVFPNEKQPEFPDLIPPPAKPHPIQAPFPSREILPLNSKPVYHQLPSDLTPPNEKEVIPPLRRDQRPIRPPWDPRPGHFHTGKPEYNRPPRPPLEMAYKRIDNLPNILPQFRPNMHKHMPPGHFLGNKLVRQPLLERPSNRPIGFFEKLQPPPPPPAFPLHKNIPNLRKGLPSLPPPRQSLDEGNFAQDRIINEGIRKPLLQTDQFGFYQTPPQIKIANRRNSDDAAEVETLQMIQAKNTEKTETESVISESKVVSIPAEDNLNDNTEKPIYKVYPVNSNPIKLDVIDNTNKESVVIGTRAELPLPPSKINKDFTYEQNPLFDTKDRNDAPVLKPHPRPSVFPIKSDFPYPLERPDPAVNHPAVPETPSNTGNGLDDSVTNKFVDDPSYISNNQWNTIGENIESRIVNGQPLNAQNSNQISVTLKTFTEKPIAVAYTPTEPNLNADKYSLPNYGSPVIPEIRPGMVENADTGHSSNVFTVSAVMHTHQTNLGKIENVPTEIHKRIDEYSQNSNHKNDIDTPNYPKLDFEAPFQASINIDQSINQGWAVVRNKNKTTPEPTEFTTISYATTAEFDIENFKPHLEGGFKPIYKFPNDDKKITEQVASEREE